MIINVGARDAIYHGLAIQGDAFFEDWDDQVVFEGANHEFHNYAMDLARNGFYRRACQVLEAGIMLYPRDVDLIADYLESGIKCQQEEKCNGYYKQLSSIPNRRQTWRSYRFMVSYLVWKMGECDTDEEIMSLRKEALDIVKRAKERFPKEELHYLSEYDIYEASGDKEIGLEKLETFLSDENRKAKIAPRCHLKFLDEMLEAGEYDKVIKFAFNGVAEAAQEQEGVDTGYFFYVLALAMDAKLIKADGARIEKNVADEILTYYQTAYDALEGNKRAYFELIRKRFRIIANLYESDRKLNDWRRNRD